MNERSQQPTLTDDARDAARYRWLRDHPDSSWEVRYLRPYQFVCKVPFVGLDKIPGTLDMAIDGMMEKQP